MKKAESLKIGIIGLGSWGTIVRNRISEIPLTEITALCDKSMDYKDIYKDYKNIPLDNIDAMLILTEPDSHFEIAKYFLENNKYVFVEKPITTSHNDFLQLKQYNNKLMSGDILFFHDYLNRWIKKYIPSDYLKIEWQTQRTPVFPLWWDNGAHVAYILQEWGIIDVEKYDKFKVEYFLEDIIQFSFLYDNKIDVEILIERGYDRNSRRITTDRGVFQLEANPIDILIKELQAFVFLAKGNNVLKYNIEKSGQIVKYLEDMEPKLREFWK